MLAPTTINVSGVEETIHCRHAATWPPYWTRFGSAEQMRGRFTPREYEQAKTWERVCGLASMSPDKCATCRFALRKDGTSLITDPSVPVVSMRRIKERARG